MKSTTCLRLGGASLLVCLALTATTGCGSSPPSRFYVLTPLSPQDVTQEPQRDVVVRIASVKLPRYLAHTEIVTRSTESGLERANFDLWAEPLENGFTRVLRTNLALLIPSTSVVVDILEAAGGSDHFLMVSLDRFDVAADGIARLEGRWRLTGPSYEERIAIQAAWIERPVDGEGYEAIAGALSETVAELARDIARAIQERSTD